MIPQHASAPSILIVDDEPDAIHSCVVRLRSDGMTNTIGCQDSREAMDIMATHTVGVVLLDLTMPHVSGEALLEQITDGYPEIPVIIITAANDVDTAVQCMRNGAFDYMVKPVEVSRLLSGIRRALELREIRDEYRSFRRRVLSDSIDNPEAFEDIVTNNQTMHSLFQYIETIAGTGQPVLITGETGVGKELFARALHDLSGRIGSFVDVNVAGLDDTAFSDTLFGHVKGAFTGADEVRGGLIEGASGGTLLLDEIGDLSIPSQVKLLRLLQERRYRPLGSDIAKQADVRVLATTNHDLESLRTDGHFRADLYYRLDTHHVHVPPLRDRLDDLPILLEHFLTKAAETLGKRRPTPPRELTPWLETYTFPGNIRELEAMVLDAISRHRGGVLSMGSFTKHIHGATRVASKGEEDSFHGAERTLQFGERLPSLVQAGDLLIAEALRRAKGNQSLAAHTLDMSRTTLGRRLKGRGTN